MRARDANGRIGYARSDREIFGARLPFRVEVVVRPGGAIFNFCDGACDAQTPEERPAQACNPLL